MIELYESDDALKFESEKKESILDVRELVVEFRIPNGIIKANNKVSIRVNQGETLGIVGESGSGKSVLCRSILRLIPNPPGTISAGKILFNNEDLMLLTESEMQRVRGTQIKMIFQNPMTSLNPVWPIGDQITEGLRIHQGLKRSEARQVGIDLLQRVGIPSPEVRFKDYPFQWSGGMLQRAVIAMAMAGDPQLLLADEPTTALDVTIQDQILALLLELQDRKNMAMLLVSHDMAIVAETCDQVAVMYAGQIVEVATVQKLFAAPMHPYTVGLINSIPKLTGQSKRLVPIAGQPPNLVNIRGGCPFAERCQYVSPDCVEIPVSLRDIEVDHQTACIYPERIERLQ